MELVYPVDPVPMTGSTKPAKASEILPVVNSNGEVIAKAARKTCHTDRLLHPVVHLHIIDRFGRIYLQKRSLLKDFLPGMWDTAVGGHVSFGEFAEEALFREASEELGLFDFNPIQIHDYIFEGETERELVIVYAAVGNFALSPDNEEVSEGRYWSEDEIDEAAGKNVLTPQFEQEFLALRHKLYALL